MCVVVGNGRHITRQWRIFMCGSSSRSSSRQTDRPMLHCFLLSSWRCKYAILVRFSPTRWRGVWVLSIRHHTPLNSSRAFIACIIYEYIFARRIYIYIVCVWIALLTCKFVHVTHVYVNSKSRVYGLLHMCAPFGVCVCVVLYTLSRPKPMMAITHATISYCSLNLLKIRKKEVVRCSYFYFIFSSFFLLIKSEYLASCVYR